MKLKFTSDNPKFTSLLPAGETLRRFKSSEELDAVVRERNREFFSQKSAELTYAQRAQKAKMEMLELLLNERCESTKVHLKPGKKGSVKLICKWGGDLTSGGKVQSFQYGKRFRAELAALEMTPASFHGGFDVFYNDEERVRDTASAFLAGLFSEGDSGAEVSTQALPGIRICSDDEVMRILDDTSVAQQRFDLYKDEIEAALNPPDTRPAEEFSLKVAALGQPPLECEYEILHRLTDLLEIISGDVESCSGSSVVLEEIEHRWGILEDHYFEEGKKKFNVSKIPDIYDSARYDLVNSREVLSQPALAALVKLYRAVSVLSSLIIPAEYGLTSKERFECAADVIGPLMRHIGASMEHQADPRLKCSLYYTCESHMHSLRNALVGTGLVDRAKVSLVQNMELHYLTNVLFYVFCSPATREGPESFYVRISMCPGASEDPVDGVLDVAAGTNGRPVRYIPVAPAFVASEKLPLAVFLKIVGGMPS